MSSEQVIEADKQQAELFLLMGVPEAFQSFLVSDDVKGVRWRYDEKFDFLVAYWPDSEGLMQELDAQMAAFNDTVPADVQRVSPDDVVLTCGVVGGCSAKKLGDIDIPQHLREDVHDPKRKWTFDD